ncbi:terminase [Streptococcus suis]|nr:terminase [Streptococcus suis]NQQ71106.1 terminase [Streptococcus suis]HEM5582643.1 helix-turn-helix domain-containing protein [Streptococcus suis]
MPKARNEKALEAEELYRKGWKLVDIAEKLGIPSGTIRRWKSNYGWDSQSERSQKNKANARKKRGGQPDNKNATGPPKGNINALKHGLFAKYLPQEVLGIVKELEEKSPIDILWENITLTYANLLHAQRVLFVQDKDDSTELISGDGLKGTTYEHHTAWDKQGKALAAIAKTQGELRQMIKAYDELIRSPLVTEEQRLRIDTLKTKLQTEGDSDGEIIIIDNWSDD